MKQKKPWLILVLSHRSGKCWERGVGSDWEVLNALLKHLHFILTPTGDHWVFKGGHFLSTKDKKERV